MGGGVSRKSGSGAEKVVEREGEGSSLGTDGTLWVIRSIWPQTLGQKNLMRTSSVSLLGERRAGCSCGRMAAGLCSRGLT